MPSGLPGRHIRTRDGGTLISLVTAEGLLPALDVAVELDQALRASPAFAPTPTSRPRL